MWRRQRRRRDTRFDDQQGELLTMIDVEKKVTFVITLDQRDAEAFVGVCDVCLAAQYAVERVGPGAVRVKALARVLLDAMEKASA